MSDTEKSATAPPSGAGKRMTKKTAMIIAVIVTLILVAAPLGYLVLTREDNNQPPQETVTVKVSGKGSAIEYKLSDLEAMEFVEQASSYQNRFGNWKGDGTYRGVALATLADNVGGMIPGDIMTIQASDGYAQNLSYYQVYPGSAYQAIQGRIVLAYTFNGTNVSNGWTDGLMIAVLAPDHAFSNEDLNQTVDRDPEFAGSTSGGSLWVKNVKNITITSVYNEWTLNITNLSKVTTNMTRTAFVSLDYWFGTSFVDPAGRNWSGVPISHVLGVADDSDPSTFNGTMAESRYRVNVAGSQGTNRTMVAADLASSGAMLAYKLNGSILSNDQAPVKILGPDIPESYQVGNVTTIVMLEPDTVILTVNGTTMMNYSMTDLKYMQATSGPGGYRKSTGTLVGPNEYTGVTVRSLVEKVYDGDDFSLKVVATDDYNMTYSSAQVMNGTFAHYEGGVVVGPDNFTMMVAYLMDGHPLDETLRIVIVGPTAPWTDGELWVKYVRYINVIPFVKDWNITLEGVSNMTMSRQTFESVASCSHHRTSCTLTNSTGSYQYYGVPLWTLVSAIDGADEPDGHYMFNDMLATAGYNVTIVDAYGVETTFNSTQVAHNSSMIIADTVNGHLLDDSEFPLRLVGSGLTEEQMAKCIARIVLTNISTDYPMWNLTLVGLKNVTIDSCTFDAFFRCGAHSVWYNFSSGGVDHSYAGIPLWILISAADGDDDIGHYVFNTTLAALGYRVNVTAYDGFNKTFNVTDVEFNDSLIVAYTLDGQYLTGTSYPLRLVGPSLSSSLSVKAIERIVLEFLPT